MNFIQRALMLLNLMPALIGAIKAIEEAIPGNGAGEQKLAAIRHVIETAYTGATDVTGKIETIWPSIAEIVTKVVGIFNAVGVFKKAAQATQATQ